MSLYIKGMVVIRGRLPPHLERHVWGHLPRVWVRCSHHGRLFRQPRWWAAVGRCAAGAAIVCSPRTPPRGPEVEGGGEYLFQSPCPLPPPVPWAPDPITRHTTAQGGLLLRRCDLARSKTSTAPAAAPVARGTTRRRQRAMSGRWRAVVAAARRAERAVAGIPAPRGRARMMAVVATRRRPAGRRDRSKGEGRSGQSDTKPKRASMPSG